MPSTEHQQNIHINGPQSTINVQCQCHHADHSHSLKTLTFRAETTQLCTQPRINKPLPVQLVYTSLLLPKREGYPLWCPQPSASCQNEEGIEIGDVGMLYDFQFESLFNIQNSNSSSTAGGSDPEGSNPHKNIKRPFIRIRGSNTPYAATKGRWCGKVSKGRVEDDPSIKFIHKHNFYDSHDGAILLLPEGSWRKTVSLPDNELFRKRAIIHGKQWFQDVEKELHGKSLGGRDFLYLVTGYDKTFSWGISAFVNESENPISMTFATHDTGDKHNKYSWNLEDSSLGPDYRCYPDVSDSCSESPSSASLKRVRNQCVFIRGYILTRRSLDDVKPKDVVREPDDCSKLFSPEDSSPDVTEPVEPPEPRPAPLILTNSYGDTTSNRDSGNAIHTTNYGSHNQSHRSIDQRPIVQGDTQSSLTSKREGFQATEGSGSSKKTAAMFSSTPLCVDPFQCSILERVLAQYRGPFKPELPMSNLLARLLGLEPSSVDQWFLDQRLKSTSLRTKIVSMLTGERTTSQLDQSGQAALLEILMEARAANTALPYLSIDEEGQSICAAAHISYELFKDWQNRQQRKPVAQVPVRAQ